MGTADGAGLGDERNHEIRPQTDERDTSPMRLSPGDESTSPRARGAPITRESAAGDGSRPHTPRACTDGGFEVTRDPQTDEL